MNNRSNLLINFWIWKNWKKSLIIIEQITTDISAIIYKKYD